MVLRMKRHYRGKERKSANYGNEVELGTANRDDELRESKYGDRVDEMRKSRPANRVDETTVLMRREREGRTASRVDKMREIRPANRANEGLRADGTK